jgi:hypothetical protein
VLESSMLWTGVIVVIMAMIIFGEKRGVVVRM